MERGRQCPLTSLEPRTSDRVLVLGEGFLGELDWVLDLVEGFLGELKLVLKLVEGFLEELKLVLEIVKFFCLLVQQPCLRYIENVSFPAHGSNKIRRCLVCNLLCRWSFCNSDDDEDRQAEINAEDQQGGNADQKKPAKAKTTAALTEPPNATAEPPKEDGEWEYYYEDLEVGAATAAGDDKNPAEAAVADRAPEGGWECPTCTLRNPLERPGCLACTTERPAQLGAAAVPAAAGTVQVVAAPARPAAPAGGGLDAYKQLENLDVIPNAETFECVVCFLEIEPGDGVVLRECLHTFCRYTVCSTVHVYMVRTA